MFLALFDICDEYIYTKYIESYIYSAKLFCDKFIGRLYCFLLEKCPRLFWSIVSKNFLSLKKFRFISFCVVLQLLMPYCEGIKLFIKTTQVVFKIYYKV